MRLAVLALVAACSGDPKPVAPPVVPRDAAVSIVDEVPGLRLPAGVTPLAYDLRLELDPDRDTFIGRVTIRLRADAPVRRIWLHADELAITRAEHRGAALSVGKPTEHEMIALGFAAPVSGVITLELDYTGRVGDELEGLFRQKFAGRWFLYSQAEATYARRFVPCFDEPRFKVPWRVTLVVPAHQVALANAPVAAERVLPDKRREVTFAEMPALPAHLLAVAVGPFALVDIGAVGANKVPVRAAVAPHHTKRLGATIAWTPKLVAALEEYLARPLPLAKLDLVAVPRFFGAMENPGLVTFEVTTLVGDATNKGFVRRHLRFLAHELAHQWFGNAVTFTWWDELWLAEAFCTWLDDKLSEADDAGLRTQRARAHALDADRAIGAKPLRRPITSTDDIENAFDAISYEKGAAVIAMFEQFVGPDRFRDAIRAYIARDGHATTQDFLAALARVDAAAAKAFAGFLDKPGAPVVDVAIDCKAAPKVVVTPRGNASVPVCIRHPAGKACTLATGATAIPLASCAPWVVGNADGRGYYLVQSTTTAISHLTPAEKLAHGADRASAVARGELAAKQALVDVDALLAAGDPYSELAAIDILVQIDRTIAAPDAWGDLLATKLAKRLTRAAVWQPRSAFDFAARDAILDLVPPAKFPKETAQRAREIVDRALRDGAQAIRSDELVRAIALALPAGGKPLYDRIATRAADDATHQEDWLEGLGYAGAALAPRAVELALDKRFESDRAWAAVAGMLGRTATRDAAWRAVRAKLAELLATLGALEADAIIEATAHLCTRDARAEVAATFAPHTKTIEHGPRALADALAAIDQCVTASGAPTARSGP